MALNFYKLCAAIHYIVEKAGKNDLDNIKLNKILWYSDVRAYLSRGTSITGDGYIRKRFGPVARRNRTALQKLAKDNLVSPGKALMDDGGWGSKFDLIHPGADTTAFVADELRIIDEVIALVIQTDSHAISERSHGEIWQLAKEDEDLPLFTVFAEGDISPPPSVIKEAVIAQ